MSPASLLIPRGQEPYINIGDILRNVVTGQGCLVTSKDHRTVTDGDDWGDWHWQEYPTEARRAIKYFESNQVDWDPSVRISVSWFDDEPMPRLTSRPLLKSFLKGS